MMDYTRRQRSLAYLLAGVAGYVDAMGFRHLGGVFVSFMSGNTTRLGVDIGSGDWMKAAQIACVIVLFVLGAALGSLIGLDGKRERRAAILWTEAALLAIAAISDNFPFAIIGSIAMALAMGVENAVFQRNGSPGIGLTYVTGALVKVGQRLAVALQGGDRWGWVSSLWLWGSLCTGAVLGAFVYGQIGLTGLWAAFVVVATLAVVAR